MRNPPHQKITYVVSALLVIATVGICLSAAVGLWWPPAEAKIIFCDVGQGDGTLITMGLTQVLIDGGPDDKIHDCLVRHMPFWDRTLELVVATHPDTDHIAGLPSVFAAYKVNLLWVTDRAAETEVFTQFRTAVLDELQAGSTLQYPFLGQLVRLGPLVTMEVVFPLVEDVAGVPEKDHIQLYSDQLTETQLSAVLKKQKERGENNNDRSIVLLLHIGQVKILLMGDLEARGEQALLNQHLITDIDILKVGHHGSKTSSIPTFVQQTRPEISIISCGVNNRYGHPHPEVIDNLEQISSIIWRTDRNGEIEVRSDGIKYWLRTGKTLSQ